MKTLRIFSRNIRDSFKSVFRNFSLSLASISCITITLIVVAISIILSYNVNKFTKLIEGDVTIVAFIDNSKNDEDIKNIKKQILALDNIQMKNVTYRDKMDISEEMMATSDVFRDIMENWTREESPIQNTYQIKVDDIKKIGKTAKEIQKIDGITTVKYGEGMVEQLVSMFDTVRKFCVYLVIALIIVTAFLIANTIKITIFSRKKEIEIMRLVGASNSNIKIPFIMEGLFLGILGSLIPILITVFAYNKIYDHFGGQLFGSFIKLVEPTPFVYFISLILLGIGMVVGMFGSWRAVRKYLKI